MKTAYVSHVFSLAVAIWSSHVHAITSEEASVLYPSHVSALMNLDADPCEDFFEYACGTWYKNTELPADRPSVDYSSGKASDEIDQTLRGVLENGAPVAGDLYKACMNVDKLNQLAMTPIAADLNRIKDAKTIKELMKLGGELNTRGMGFLSKLQVANDYFDAKTNVLFLMAGTVTLPNPKYYAGDMFAQYEQPLREYITTLFKLNGATADEATSTADAVIRVESAFIQWASAPNPRPYWRMSIHEASRQYPLLIGTFLTGTGALTESALSDNSPIVNMHGGFFGALEAFIADATNLEDVRTYLTYRWLNTNAPYLSEDFQTASFKFYGTALNGIQKPVPRWKTCVGKVTAQLPDMMGQYFYDKKASLATESIAKKMIAMIETAMKANINAASWLDDTTRQNALAKLRKVTTLFGRSQHKESFDFTIKTDAFAEDHHKIERAQFIKSMNKVGKPVDKTEWARTAAEVNAYFSFLNNQMVFPIGIFQNPFFDPSFPAAENFGAIGVVIGHELTHGYDSSGRSFDGDGNYRNWWTPSTAQAFDARAQCMIDQYSSFQVSGLAGNVIGNVDGELTIGENIADNGGIKLAFNAYREYVKELRRLQHSSNEAATAINSSTSRNTVNSIVSTTAGVRKNDDEGETFPVSNVGTPVSSLSKDDNEESLEFDPLGPHHTGNPDQPNQYGVHKMPPPIKPSDKSPTPSIYNSSSNSTVLIPPQSPSPVPSVSPTTSPSAPPSLRSLSAANGKQFENDQLFFVAYAQSWCTKKSDTAALNQIREDPHAPARWRVNGVAMNSREFSRALKCAASKPMNPPTKCEVW